LGDGQTKNDRKEDRKVTEFVHVRIPYYIFLAERSM
jgi:hypothetical protein